MDPLQCKRVVLRAREKRLVDTFIFSFSFVNFGFFSDRCPCYLKDKWTTLAKQSEDRCFDSQRSMRGRSIRRRWES